MEWRGKLELGTQAPRIRERMSKLAGLSPQDLVLSSRDALTISKQARGLKALNTSPADPVQQADQLLTSLIQQHASDITAAKQQILSAGGRLEALAAYQALFTPISDKLLAQTPRTVDEIIGKAGVAQQLKQTGSYPASHAFMNELQTRIDKLAVSLGVINPGEHVDAGIINTPVPNADNTGGANEVDWAGIFKLMKSWEQLDGVNGHEMGHGAHRDDLRGAVTGAIMQEMGLTLNPDKLPAKVKKVLDGIATGGKYTDAQLRNPDFLWTTLAKDPSVDPKLVEQLKLQTVSSAQQQTIESAADIEGVTALHGVGENPQAMADGLANLPDAPNDAQTRFKLGIFDDHPYTSDRVAAIDAFIKQKGWAAGPSKPDPAYLQAVANFPTPQMGSKAPAPTSKVSVT